MGLGFTDGLVLPKTSQPYLETPSNSYGLSSRQMAALGLTEDSISKPLEANEVLMRSSQAVLLVYFMQACGTSDHCLSGLLQELITAKACYSSDKVHENTRITPRMGAGTGAAPGQAPPDLPSLLLDGRICYIGMPVSSHRVDDALSDDLLSALMPVSLFCL